MGWYCLLGLMLIAIAGLVGYLVGKYHSDQEVDEICAMIQRGTSTERTHHER